MKASLLAAELEVHTREMAAGEGTKTLEEVNAIHDWLLKIKLRRDDVVVGGFAASTYMRGVPLVKVPTSLEGMVDSSVGGKTALNHPRARNLIGTFFHPRWSDVSLLRDEPPNELRAAWAEVVKYSMLESSLLRDQVMGVTLFDKLEASVNELVGLEKSALLEIIARCVALKAQVVAGDERDWGSIESFSTTDIRWATRWKRPRITSCCMAMPSRSEWLSRLACPFDLASPMSRSRPVKTLC